MCKKNSSQPFYIVFEIVLKRENDIKFAPLRGMNSEGECIYATLFFLICALGVVCGRHIAPPPVLPDNDLSVPTEKETEWVPDRAWNCLS